MGGNGICKRGVRELETKSKEQQEGLKGSSQVFGRRFMGRMRVNHSLRKGEP